MELMENNLQENNISNNIEIEKEQNNFLETTLGKTINAGMDIGLRMLLPDLIENQVIEIKDTLLQEGLSEGIKKVVSSAIDLGKSAIRNSYRKLRQHITNASSSSKRWNNRRNVRHYRLCIRKD